MTFCDVEIMYGAQNGVEIEFISDDLKAAPFRIYCIEIFAASRKDFNLKDKMRKLCK